MNFNEARRQFAQLKADYEGLDSTVRMVTANISRTLGLIERFSGSSTLKGTLESFQRMIMGLNSVEMAYRAVQIARMAAGDPLAWFGAAVSVGTVIVSLVAEAEIYRPSYEG